MKKLFLAIGLLSVNMLAFAGSCDYSWQSDSIGRNCGERSAYTEYGSRKSEDPFYQMQKKQERQQREYERQQREYKRQQRAYERQQQQQWNSSW